MSIVKSADKIFANFLTAILTAMRVFLRFVIKESNTRNPIIIYRL
ncbi:MAG: hypothetical protein PWQ16_1583 [bacterium]|jgi:hypothetical protein|nr:hypothetical protein [bacterium]